MQKHNLVYTLLASSNSCSISSALLCSEGHWRHNSRRKNTWSRHLRKQVITHHIFFYWKQQIYCKRCAQKSNGKGSGSFWQQYLVSISFGWQGRYLTPDIGCSAYHTARVYLHLMKWFYCNQRLPLKYLSQVNTFQLYKKATIKNC